MGGDGGVVATDRRYMRGAGTADHTGDYGNSKGAATAAVQQKDDAREAMTTCALTKTPLLATNGTSSLGTIVADPYGRLYHKEAAVRALLRRKQQQELSGDPNLTLGPHIRRLADLHEVRFHRDDPSSTVVSCPITGKALTGSIPAILLVPGRVGTPNVVSEGALKQLSPEELREEYGPIERQIRLAPPPPLLKTIQEQVRIEQEKEEEERNAKKAAKSGTKKRKRNGALAEGGDAEKNTSTNGSSGAKGSVTTTLAATTTKTPPSTSTFTVKAGVGEHIRSRVDSAIQKNAVLSSLFVNKDTSKQVSNKERKDNLFAR